MTAAAEAMDCDMANSAQAVQQPYIVMTAPVQSAHGPASPTVALMPPPSMLPPSMPPPAHIPPQRTPQQVSTTAADNPFCRLSYFDVEKKIGRGQFSVVFRARCKLNSQVVALKKVQVSLRYASVYNAGNTFLTNSV